MPVVDETTVEISQKGAISEAIPGYATEKIQAVADTSRERVHHIEIRLVMESDPARERPALAEAGILVDGSPVRAHVAAPTMIEAVDLLVDRLTRRLRRHEERRHRLDSRHRTGSGATWRHGDLPSQRPEYLDVPVEDREVVRRKTFAWGPMSLDEAAFELDHLAHDFYLFTDAATGADAVLSHGDDDVLVLMHPEPAAVDLADTVAPIEVAQEGAPRLGEVDARETLDASGRRWLFHIAEEDGRGRVLYRRYDGHYGLILPA